MGEGQSSDSELSWPEVEQFEQKTPGAIQSPNVDELARLDANVALVKRTQTALKDADRCLLEVQRWKRNFDKQMREVSISISGANAAPKQRRVLPRSRARRNRPTDSR